MCLCPFQLARLSFHFEVLVAFRTAKTKLASIISDEGYTFGRVYRSRTEMACFWGLLDICDMSKKFLAYRSSSCRFTPLRRKLWELSCYKVDSSSTIVQKSDKRVEPLSYQVLKGSCLDVAAFGFAIKTSKLKPNLRAKLFFLLVGIKFHGSRLLRGCFPNTRFTV